MGDLEGIPPWEWLVRTFEAILLQGKSRFLSGSGYLERPIWSLNLSGLLEIKGFIVIQFPLEVDTIRSTTQEGPSSALGKKQSGHSSIQLLRRVAFLL